MKTKILPIALAVLSFNSFADVIDLGTLGKTGQYCPGSTLSIEVPAENSYVERILISAEGIRRDGFIKVYADGEMVHNIGIPGYDPDYSFRVRRNVRNISLKFEETCARILDGKIFTPPKAPENYRRYSRNNMQGDNWGAEFLEITRSLSQDLYTDPEFHTKLWPKVLLPMKKIAILENVSEVVRDERSLITAYRALKMAKIINDNQKFLDSLLDYSNFDYVVTDILRIKEDILERYDVKEKDLTKKVMDLKKELEIQE